MIPLNDHVLIGAGFNNQVAWVASGEPDTVSRVSVWNAAGGHNPTLPEAVKDQYGAIGVAYIGTPSRAFCLKAAARKPLGVSCHRSAQKYQGQYFHLLIHPLDPILTLAQGAQ